ncbi:hypothetical protein [Hyperthermus butylicus]|uniref:Uncharacterized protein n=1 Tax=Hyperthermus butylicus (strain DSM 5456 / JCM 9403 / PLM1-5) TaxID=415426 RepID=A2BJH4_HYPBU|nr:hypothetical protein [Hyperthermus butylicus]ABM80135.1 hypothetical protein Hbut_0263 [Hyperthermus butylicus DSM 5456]
MTSYGLGGLEIRVEGVEGLDSLLAPLALGGIVFALILALIVLLAYLVARVASMFRFDSHEYTVDMPVEKARRRLGDLLRFRGLNVVEEGGRIVVDDIIRIVLTLRGEESGETRIFYYAEAKTWLVVAAILLLIIHVALSLAVGLIAYLKYDDARKAVRAALSELGTRQVY